MAKEIACKECGFLAKEATVCSNCNSRNFVDKFKGTVVVFDQDNSTIAKSAKSTGTGKFALKY